MTLRVHISPGPDQISRDNGIGQVIHAQYKYLEAHGITLMDTPGDAEIIAGHIQQGDLPRIDVLHCHGLYWSGDPGSGDYQSWHHEANSRILDAARKAYIVTVPSEWVAMPFKRDMRISPHVIGHGVDLDALPPPSAKRGGYVLWNKNRADDVCSPAAAQALAGRGIRIVSTFGDPGPTMQIIGPQPHAAMLDVLGQASIYLATTKETFGIGTLEAMALGVPVVGYRWGGTLDLVPEDCGILVEPGDIDGLAVAIAAIKDDYQWYVDGCRDRARRYAWEYAAKAYAAVYHQAAAMKRAEERANGISVVITNYNHAQYVGGAVRSAIHQTHAPTELIIVDDGSTDESPRIIPEMLNDIPGGFTVKYLPQNNQGVAAARNNGIAAASQNFIVCLDADDELAPDYLKACHAAMVADRGLGVAYTGLSWIDSKPPKNIWHSLFDWEEQTTPGNPPRTTIHCAAMFRRSMWGRAGGYQQIYAPGEDTEFFTRGLSVGYTAKQVTDAPLFLYRNTPGSASKTKQYRPIDTWHPWMRDKLYPMAAPAKKQPYVRSYSAPMVTVVIPVGPGHGKYVPAALDSLLGQTFRNWAVIVVDDSNSGDIPMPEAIRQRYPFVRLITAGQHGTGEARNLALEFVTSPLVLWLDADDYLLPQALTAMVEKYLEAGGGFVYTDWYAAGPDGNLVAHQTPDYDQALWLDRSANAVTVLMAADDARLVDGFDPDLPGWEDWDFFIKLTIAGCCGVRVPEPLMVYRHTTGARRETALQQRPKLLDIFRSRYAAYVTGDKAMANCGSCGGSGQAINQAKQMLGIGPTVDIPPPLDEHAQVVRMEYIGPYFGAVSYHGTKTRKVYRGGLDPSHKYIDAEPADVAGLLDTEHWRAISPMPKPKPAPTPISEILATSAMPENGFNHGPLPFDDTVSDEELQVINEQAAAAMRQQRDSR